jgi:hypothetical protein
MLSTMIFLLSKHALREHTTTIQFLFITKTKPEKVKIEFPQFLLLKRTIWFNQTSPPLERNKKENDIEIHTAIISIYKKDRILTFYQV